MAKQHKKSIGTEALRSLKRENHSLKVIRYKLYSRFNRLHSLLFGEQIGTHLRGYPKYLHIGKDVHIGPNVHISTGRHDPTNPNQKLEPKHVYIEDSCWIGTHAVILPGVHLGPGTIVGAGAIVTHSFPDGHCIIAGVPAKKIKDLIK